MLPALACNNGRDLRSRLDYDANLIAPRIGRKGLF